MTDEGSFAAKTAINLNMVGILCVKHKQPKVLEATKGLGSLADDFKRDMNAVLFDDVSPADLCNMFKAAREKYGHVETPSDFIDRLEKIKDKICYAHTKEVFTCGQVATSRAEGTNSRIKGNGKLKAYLNQCTLVELVTHIINIAEKQDLQAIEELKKLRLAGKRVSDFYSKELAKSKTEALPLMTNVTRRDDGKYGVQNGANEETVDLCSPCIHRGDEYKIPSCTCAFYRSTYIICPCICAAITKAGKHEDIDNVHNVHPFWHLRGHPMWRRALDKLGKADYDDFPELPPLSRPEQHPDSAIKEAPLSGPGQFIKDDPAPQPVEPRLFESFEYPDDDAVRHSELKNACEQICALAENHPAANSFLKEQLELLHRKVEDIREGRDPSRSNAYRPPMILSSKRKGGKASKASMDNKSRLTHTSGGKGSSKRKHTGPRRPKAKKATRTDETSTPGTAPAASAVSMAAATAGSTSGAVIDEANAVTDAPEGGGGTEVRMQRLKTNTAEPIDGRLASAPVDCTGSSTDDGDDDEEDYEVPLSDLPNKLCEQRRRIEEGSHSGGDRETNSHTRRWQLRLRCLPSRTGRGELVHE